MIESRALGRAQMNNESVIEYVGLSSNDSTRKRVAEQERNLLAANNTNKGSLGRDLKKLFRAQTVLQPSRGIWP